MMQAGVLFKGGLIFDGTRLLEGYALGLRGGVVEYLGPEGAASDLPTVDLGGDILAPGYVDLQVNGGDGVMFNDDPSVAVLSRIAAAHRRLGATTILPTLITDTPEHSRAAVRAVAEAVAAGVPGIAGVHLEGPHLSVARKGAHDPALIRPLSDADMGLLTDAARRLPCLMITLAPENATPEQVADLARAGAVVSLGHSDCSFSTAMAYAKAGATTVTHLFNAMSQLGNREPGLVGAALANGGLSAGMIADGVHVHPATMRAALAAKSGPAALFLVSDAMAPAGTDQREFTLNGRVIRRANGRLLLADGTLAGADLDLTTAINVMTASTGASLDVALAMATSIPARVARLGAGTIVKGQTCDVIRLSPTDNGLTLSDVLTG